MDTRAQADLLKAALAYARRGVPVFPCEEGGKRPLTQNGFLDATRDPHWVEGWWRRWPGANVGVPTGIRSNLLVLDVDTRDGGYESLRTLEIRNGEAPPTARAQTGGGGLHLYFRYPSPKAHGRAAVKNSAGLLGPGLDVRGEGGYVVVPPSRTLEAYAWVDRAPPADPGWLLALLEQADKDLAGGDTLF